MAARIVLVAALAVAVAGCSALGLAERVERGEEQRAAPPAAGPAAPARPAHPAPRRRRAVPVVVAVIDGDTLRRVRGARVSVGGRSRLTGRRGEARVPLRRRAALVVSVRARGYGPRAVRIQFRRQPRASVRIYRPELQWRMYGATPARTQAHPRIRLRPPFRVVWSRGVGSLVEFPAVVSEGVAYVGNLHGTVWAIEMRRGRVVWKHDPPGGKMASSPAVWRDALVVHGMDGIVRLLDRRTGRLRWARRIGSPIESSPVVRHGIDYFGAWNGRVYALDLRTARVRWTQRTGAKITSSAAIRGRTLWIGDYAGRLRAIDVRTGRVRWRASVNGRIYGTPAVAGGRIFVPSSTGRSLTAFSTRGSRLWTRRTGGYVYSSPAVWGGRVMFGSYDGRLWAVSARSGRVLWRAYAGGPVSGAAVVVAGVAYAGSTRARMVGVDVRTGRVVFRFPHGEYVPVSGNARRLLLHGFSRIWAVESRRPRR